MTATATLVKPSSNESMAVLKRQIERDLVIWNLISIHYIVAFFTLEGATDGECASEGPADCAVDPQCG